MDRVTQPLWRGVEEPVLSVAEGTSAGLIYPCCSELFNHRNPTTGSAAIRTGWSRVHLFMQGKRACMAAEKVDVGAGHSEMPAGPGGSKSSEQHGEN
jgi:hypothetical protein